MGRILLIVVLLVAYGSLYPFQFHSTHLTASPVWLLLHSWPAGIDRSMLVDIVLNVLIYLPVGFFGGLSVGRGRAFLLAAGVSASIEMAQLFDTARTCSTLDLASNIAGGAAGVSLAHVYGSSVRRWLAESPRWASLRPSPALLLLGCFVCFQTFPFIPYLRLYLVRMKLAALLQPGSFSAMQMVTAAVEWLVVARLLKEIRLGAGTLTLLMLLAPSRLLIANRTFTWAEMAGAVCAWILWIAWPSGNQRQTRWMAWSVVALLVVRGLAPFHWQSSASAFSWTPFAGFLNADKNAAAIGYFEKSFLYGTVVWFLAESGYAPLLAGLGVAAMLAVIELVQTHLPGRTPEITDPLYTLVLAAVLQWLAAADRRVRNE